jgi:phosphonate transport system substrate-binding protein
MPSGHLLLTAVLSLMLLGCSEQQAPVTPSFSDGPASGGTVYRFGIHPLHNPSRLHEIFGPLMAYLNRHIPEASFRVEASRNYAAYDNKLFGGEFHFSLPNPYQTVTALDKGYRVFGKMGDDHNFRGIILVRRDSDIREVSDLKGRPVSYPAPTALAATMLPQHYLHSHGLDIMQDVENRYVGSQESAVMNVFLGHTAAGATWPPPWQAMVKERPELARQLEVKWQTASLPNNGLVVRDDIPRALVDQVATLLLELHQHAEGRAMLQRMELSRFEAADDTTYQPVRDFLNTFQAEIRNPREAS